jgi:hypothetical protein
MIVQTAMEKTSGYLYKTNLIYIFKNNIPSVKKNSNRTQIFFLIIVL